MRARRCAGYSRTRCNRSVFRGRRPNTALRTLVHSSDIATNVEATTHIHIGIRAVVQLDRRGRSSLLDYLRRRGGRLSPAAVSGAAQQAANVFGAGNLTASHGHIAVNTRNAAVIVCRHACQQANADLTSSFPVIIVRIVLPIDDISSRIFDSQFNVAVREFKVLDHTIGSVDRNVV